MRLFIVNKRSGRGRGKKVWTKVRQILEIRKIPYQVEFTEYPGHATEIAREAVHSNIEAVVAVGGDGTLHEVGNGLVGTEIPLGYIPAGSGNDFARAENIPRDPEQALERILRHQVRLIDTADLGGKVLVGFTGIGFDAQIADLANKSSLKRFFRKFIYLVFLLRCLWTYRPTKVTISLDGKSYHYDGVWLIAINNTSFYGGGMKICPDAQNDDGWLDICCVKYCRPRTLLRVFPQVYKGTHINHPFVSIHRGKEITVQSERPLIIHVDGEIYGTTPLSVTIRPKSLRIL
ncbi:diacylglycerol/lipid kinase family protein [Thermoflavimicrobium dichotomicum]|uniref:Lipid kinase, YegS/Rv2252/BmrU family n=1 Tax=Thermoflavimicrobium dichotomicum TaxID=46223 RepID=A0A1I3PLS8_9BACL|nr:diacylglycerol kinase family protein [Thermoflavimicrobium dichotomicum]SFJ22287.1 lipid kinase, YegS/Rv2252/BmrU family [Thermoflavimicrobium dichotomicum]